MSLHSRSVSRAQNDRAALTATPPHFLPGRTTYQPPARRPAMTVLALSYLTNQYGPPSTITTVSCKDRQLSDTENLTPCSQLTRLDLSSNQFGSLLRLSSAASLTHLTLASNRLTTLKHVQHLRQLQLLNIAHNAVESLDALSPLAHLVALIANNNAIQTLPVPSSPSASTPRLPPQLHTLVLSHNQIVTLPPASLAHLTQLTKLSLSHNQLTALPGAAVAQLTSLVELRLNNNQLTSLPAQLASCQRLKLIDVGSNAIEEWSGVECVERLPYLRNLQLRGNGVERALGEAYREEVLKRLPLLAVLDSVKVQGRKGAKDGQRMEVEEGHTEERKEVDSEAGALNGGRKQPMVSEIKEEPSSKPAVKGKGRKADSSAHAEQVMPAGGMRMDSGRKRRMEQTAKSATKGKSPKTKASKQASSPHKPDSTPSASAKSPKRSKTSTASLPAPDASVPSPAQNAADEAAADEAEEQAVELDALTAEARRLLREKEKARKAEERLIREKGKAAGVLDVKVHRKEGTGGGSSAFSVEQLTRGEEERDVVGGGAGWE